MLFGDAVDCVVAARSGGCGRGSECKVCTVRQFVERTFTDGYPQMSNIALTVRSGSAEKILTATICTAKVAMEGGSLVVMTLHVV